MSGAAPGSVNSQGHDQTTQNAQDGEDQDRHALTWATGLAYMSPFFFLILMLFDLVDVTRVYASGKPPIKRDVYVLTPELGCVIFFFLQMCGFVETIRQIRATAARVRSNQHPGGYKNLSEEVQERKVSLRARLKNVGIRWKGAIMIGVTVADIVFYVVHIVCVYQLQGYQRLEYFMI